MIESHIEEVESRWYGRMQILREDAEMSAAVRSGALWERKLVKAFSQHLSAGGAAVDVGANFGCHTVVLAHLVGARGHVLAYEPQPLLADMLQANTAAPDAEVAVRRVAAGSSAATIPVVFPDYSSSPNPGGWSIDLGSGRSRPHRIELDNRTHDLSVVRLDDDIDAHGRRGVDLIKIDVEGMELDVLAGARDVLSVDGPALFVETRDHRDAIDVFLAALGYCSLVSVGTPAGADYASVPLEREGFLRTSLDLLEA
jgi:FkbM family methyltransferase